MTIQSQPQDTSGMSDMEAFVSKFGHDEALEAIDDPNAQIDRRGNVQPSQPATEETPLDSATLEALGLKSDGEKSGDQDDGIGTNEEPDIDLASAASVLGLEPEDLIVHKGKVQVRTKVDGEEATASLQELRKGYQLQSHFTRQNEAFLQQRQAWENARQQQEMQLAQQAQIAAGVLNEEEERLKQTYTKDWEKLREEDPAEYAAQVAEYNQKLAQVRQKKQGLGEAFRQQQVAQQQRHLAAMQQARQVGTQHLAKELGWKDEKQFKEGAGKLREYLLKNGVQAQEIDATLDPRALILADKARRYDELMAKVDVANKRVSEAESPSPKTPQGSSPQSFGRSGKRKLDEAKNRLRQDHSLDSAAEVFDHLGIV